MNKYLSNKYLLFISRLIVGSVFIIASCDKIAHPELFALSVASYKMLPVELINLAAIILPWLEMISGLFLISGFMQKSSSTILAFLLTFFIGAIAIAMMQHLKIDCGCFGAARDSQVGWGRIFEDIFLLMLCGHIYYYSPEMSQDDKK
jgi:putative oxidoreductase